MAWCRWVAVGDDEWPQQKAQRDVMLADFDFQNGFGDRYVCHPALELLDGHKIVILEFV